MCSSEVPDTERTLADEFTGTDGFVRLWVYDGPVERAALWAETWGIADPVLGDEDGSVNTDYFVSEEAGDAFAANPRHYVIGRDGTLVYVSAQVAPGGLLDAIRAALVE